jgi:hypothetical protein
MTCGTRLLSMEELSCLDLNRVESGWIAECGCKRARRNVAHSLDWPVKLHRPVEYIHGSTVSVCQQATFGRSFETGTSLKSCDRVRRL